jgi:RNA polymerase sigma-B factor
MSDSTVRMTRSDDAVDQHEIFRRYRTTGDRAIRNQIIEEHRGLAITLARRFEGRGEPLDDLIQVAQVGILKAVERFDPERGVPFAAFASPTVQGELRRHFRDTTWSVKVPRDTKDLAVRLPRVVEELSGELGRSPSIPELAQRLGSSVDETLGALEAASAYRAGSLDAPVRAGGESTPLAATVGSIDVELTRTEASETVRVLLATLPERERRIVELRFFGDRTQSEIAAEVGISQMHVSRLLRRALQMLSTKVEPVDSAPN